MRKIYFCLFLLIFVFNSFAQERIVNIKLVETSDIHGNFFPYDFMKQAPAQGSLARVYAFVQKNRQTYKNNLLLIDNGDILQGQPTTYYSNFIDTVSPHLSAQIMNYMGYDVGNMGNHDIEVGHSVFDRWVRECNFPVLGANILRTSDQTTYLKPYQVFVRDGVKIVVLGMTTPAIPAWVAEPLYAGIQFADMEKSAKKWMKIIKTEEKPDIIIGLFHAGKKPVRLAGKYNENASVTVARRVPGFDVVLIGHDHEQECSKVVNVKGDSVLVINPANNGNLVGDIDIEVRLKDDKVISKKIDGVLSNMNYYKASKEYMKEFSSQYMAVKTFVTKKIGQFNIGFTTRPAYFGPSVFVDFIHTFQLMLTGADVSLVAPLSFDAEVRQGDVSVGDMFNLYNYENKVYTMELTGKEIKKYLEASYALWTNRMKCPDDHLLLLKNERTGLKRNYFVNFFVNFDSAAGIIYIVDVTKPTGHKVTIYRMADGKPFYSNKKYKVALTSYKGNGGGELLTKGAGISQNKLKDRIISISDKDFRFFLIDYIQKKGVIEPKSLNQWKFVPESWTIPAARRDYEILFGDEE